MCSTQRFLPGYLEYHRRWTQGRSVDYQLVDQATAVMMDGLTCLIATVSPVAFSMPL